MRSSPHSASAPLRGGATTISLLLHGALGVSLVVWSAPPGRSTAPPEQIQPLIYVPPPPPLAAPRVTASRPTTPPPVAPPSAPAEAAPIEGPPSAPPLVPDLLPPPSAGAASLPGLAGASSAAVASTEAGPQGADPSGPLTPPSGIWDGEQVEEAVAILRSGPPPRYPSHLQAAGVEAQIVARFVVDTTCQLRPASLTLTPAATDRAFAEAVRHHLERTRYRCARVGGRAVPQWVEQSFAFTLRR